MIKILPKSLCPCGSGKSFRQCHGDRRVKDQAESLLHPSVGALDVTSEHIRKSQQGLGLPIFKVGSDSNPRILVGTTSIDVKPRDAFVNVLDRYIVDKLGRDWISSESKIDRSRRNPLVVWMEACAKQTFGRQSADGVQLNSVEFTGALCCYLGTAYALYLLEHNVELQERLLKRLKTTKQFQGAYQELIAISAFIRAGFDVNLENESEGKSKHGEFIAVHPRTLKSYWVEVKARGVAGQLGKTNKDGTTSENPTGRLKNHVELAFAKPTSSERIVLVELNWRFSENRSNPDWFNDAVGVLKNLEVELPPGQSAHVFVTNTAFHLHLEKQAGPIEFFVFGLGIPDAWEKSNGSLTEQLKSKRKHEPIWDVAIALSSHPQLPQTLDGTPASAVSGLLSYFRKGRRFTPPESWGIDSDLELEAVRVDEEKMMAHITFTTMSGYTFTRARILSPAEVEDYRFYGPSLFGQPDTRGLVSTDAFHRFESLVGFYEGSSRIELNDFAGEYLGSSNWSQLDDLDLLLHLCEHWISVGIDPKQYLATWFKDKMVMSSSYRGLGMRSAFNWYWEMLRQQEQSSRS